MTTLRRKIMWVDDDKWLADIYGGVLIECGYLVETFGDIDSAKAAFEKDPAYYDAVILELDIKPGKCYADIFERTQRPVGSFLRDDIRARNSEVRIIFFSNFAILLKDFLIGSKDSRQFGLSKREHTGATLADKLREIMP